MIEVIVGGQAAEKLLLYLENYGEAYAKEVSRTFLISLSAVQKQLQKFESNGILVSQLKGKTRIFTWNPRYALLTEFRTLLQKALSLLPDSEQKKYFRKRIRPRRTGKPI